MRKIYTRYENSIKDARTRGKKIHAEFPIRYQPGAGLADTRKSRPMQCMRRQLFYSDII